VEVFFAVVAVERVLLRLRGVRGAR